MNETALPRVSGPDFNGEALHQDSALNLLLTGTADLRVQKPLHDFLVEVDELARQLSVDEVAVDLRKLEFMNSSCFKAFVSWIGRLQELEPDSQYRIRFVSEPSMLWRKRSLHALSCFAVDLISIET